MLSKLRLLNRNNINYYTKKQICNISLKDNNRTIIDNKFNNKNIEKIIKDVNIIKNKYNDLNNYNLINFLLNYKSFDKNYKIDNIIKEIDELKYITSNNSKLTNNQILKLIISNKKTNYMNDKNVSETIEVLSFIGLISCLGVIITII